MDEMAGGIRAGCAEYTEMSNTWIKSMSGIKGSGNVT